MKLYKTYAKYYDSIYYESQGKWYKKQVNFIISQIKQFKIKGKRLLDVACGTGNHAKILKQKGYSVTGVDLNQEMLKIARKKVKGIRFIQQDMKKLKLNKKFDVITCFFSSIHYNKNLKELKKTLINFYKHLDATGILIFDCGFVKERLDLGHRYADGFETKKFTLTRCSRSYIKNKKLVIPFVYVVQKDNKNIVEEDKHELGIFSIEEIKKIMNKVGFKTEVFFEIGLHGNKSSKIPYFIGVKR